MAILWACVCVFSLGTAILAATTTQTTSPKLAGRPALAPTTHGRIATHVQQSVATDGNSKRGLS